MENAILGDDDVKKLCMFMRIIDLEEKFPNEMNGEVLGEHIIKLKAGVASIMNRLSDEERNHVLEMHKLQAEHIEKKKLGK